MQELAPADGSHEQNSLKEAGRKNGTRRVRSATKLAHGNILRVTGARVNQENLVQKFSNSHEFAKKAGERIGSFSTLIENS
jgi:hypothetical protein